MTDLIKIAVDAMGGDSSPNKVIEGIILNHKSNKNLFYKIFGDENKISKLINNKINKDFFNNLSALNGQALHAETLEFIHPIKKKLMSFKSKLPIDFKKTLDLLNNLSG